MVRYGKRTEIKAHKSGVGFSLNMFQYGFDNIWLRNTKPSAPDVAKITSKSGADLSQRDTELQWLSESFF